jgi:hypothetical protein
LFGSRVDQLLRDRSVTMRSSNINSFVHKQGVAHFASAAQGPLSILVLTSLASAMASWFVL